MKPQPHTYPTTSSSSAGISATTKSWSALTDHDLLPSASPRGESELDGGAVETPCIGLWYLQLHHLQAGVASLACGAGAGAGLFSVKLLYMTSLTGSTLVGMSSVF